MNNLLPAPLLVISQQYEEVAAAIHSSVSVAQGAENSPEEGFSQDDPRLRRVKALWDTGATQTCISGRLATELNLEPRSFEVVFTASGTEHDVPVYVAHLVFSNQTQFLNWEMVRFTASGDDEVDLIVGMDIIMQGDFALTNVGGRSLFSFRLPSMQSIDFEANFLLSR